MADERPQYTTVAKTKNYWMSPQALNITLNARNEANRIAAGVASGARFFCHFKDIGDPQAEALFGYDVGHNFCSWPLIISPTYFYTDEVIYPHIAIPRIDRGNSQAMVVFPTKELDLWGYEVEEVPMQDEEGNYIDDDGNIVDDPEDAATAYVRVKLPGTETDADPVGSDEFYYIYLHGMLTEPFYSGGMLIRQWSPEIDTGRLNTDETWGEAVTLEELAREMKKKVDVDWFKRLFTIHGTNRTKPDEDNEDDDNQLYPGEISTGDGEEEDDEEWEGDDTPREVQPNDMEHEITDIEMMFGAWTEQFLSALGKNDQGGSGGGMLYGLDVIGNTLMLVPDGPSMSVQLPESGVSQSEVNTLIENYLETNHYLNDLTGFYWWGRQFTTGSDAIKGNIDDTGHINPETGGFYEIGTEPDPNSVDPVLQQGKRYKAIHAEEVWIGGIQLKAENGGVHVVGRGLYADTYISALGHNDQGGGGGATIYGLDLNGRTLSLERDSTNTSVELPDPGLDANAVTSLVRNYLDVNHYINDLSQFTWWGNTFTNNTTAITGDIEDTGHILPEYDSQYNLGSSSKKYSALYIDEIHIGNAVISWDANNRGIHITKGLYSDEWVSALGANDQGSGGGATIYGLDLNGTTLTLERDSSQTSVNLSSIIPTLSWANISGKPNSLQGYGITDGVSTSALWWGQQISNGEVTGDITLGSGDALKWKAATGSGTYSMISMDNSGQRKQFSLGTLEVPCDTTLTGSTLTLRSGTTATTHNASLAADGVFTVEKLRIGTIVISHDTTHGGLHVESAGLYADNYLSALGANDQGGSGSSVLYGLQLSGSSLSLMPNGSSQSVDLADTLVTLSSSQNISGIKKFGSIHADTVYLGGSDTDCFLNRNGNNLILQNNRSAGTVILAGNANEPTYRKLGSGSTYTDNLILHSGSLNTDGSNNLTGITVGGTTYNISGGGGGGDVSSITLTNGGTNLQPTNGIITLPASTASEYGIVKVVNVLSSSPNVSSNTGSAVRNYGVQLRADGVAFVHVPWEDNDTKNTTGTGVTQSASKYYLIGATQQSSDGVQTYTQANCYMKSGLLYSDGNKVATETWVGDQGFLTSGDVVTKIKLTSGGTNLTPSSGIITLPASTTSEYGILKVANVLSSSPNVNSNTGSAVRNYGVQLRADGVAFVHVPWEDNDTKNTTGTGVTQSASKYYLIGATQQSSDGVQTYTQANCYMKSGLLYSDGNKVATETWVSNKGYVNTSDLANYLPLTGGTLTGALTIGSSTSDPKDLSLIGTLKTTKNIVAINFRPDHQQYNSKIEYMADGDEALVWANQNAVTSFIFKSGLDLSNTSNWTTITPSLQIKGQSVYINSLIRNGITPSYNFHVNGSSYLGGRVGIGGAPSNSYQLQVSGKIHADDNIETDESFVGSDMRRKDVVSIITDEDFDLENIARAPLFRFIWNDKEDKSLHVGTSAQYWQTLLPELITTGANDRLYQDYAATALAAAITIARKVMTHEEEIAALQKRVDAVEKENERLRTEIEQLKAA